MDGMRSNDSTLRSPPSGGSRWRRVAVRLLVGIGSLAIVPVASAHGSNAHAPDIPQWYAFVLTLAGGLLVGVSVLARRRRRLSPYRAIQTTFLGLVVAAVGAIGLVQLSPIDGLPAHRPGIRQWYSLISLIIGASIILVSMILGGLRWPTRPRYAAIGVVLGAWVLYPSLFDGATEVSHPLGYAIVLSAFFAIGYVLWRDGQPAIRLALATRAARWFGVGVMLVTALFFLFSAGMLTVIPDAGIGFQWTHSSIAINPITGPLVLWPAIEFWFPHVPLGGYVSVGMALVVVALCTLVGLNAAFVAQQWLSSAAVESSGTTSGAAALAGPNACCCCGPVLSQLAVVALGPSAAAPLYWVFVDISSPVGAIFLVGSFGLLTASIVRAGNSLSTPARDAKDSVLPTSAE